jgi:hypothetical protein
MEQLHDEETALQRDQARIAGCFILALHETATKLGGEKLAAEVADVPTDADSAWPANALRLLDSRHAGAAEEAYSLAEAIQARAHEIEAARGTAPFQS